MSFLDAFSPSSKRSRSRRRRRTGSKPEPPDALPEVSKVPTPHLTGKPGGEKSSREKPSGEPGTNGSPTENRSGKDQSEDRPGETEPRRVYLSKAMPPWPEGPSHS